MHLHEGYNDLSGTFLGPPGNLYFNDIEDFASIVGDVPVLHSYKITEVLKDGHYNITVEFTNSVKGPSVPYAKVFFRRPLTVIVTNE